MHPASCRRRRAVASAVVALLVAAPCAPLAAQGATPHAQHAAAERATVAAHPGDARFMTHMIDHHAQALVMSAMVPRNTSRPELRLLAERIAVSQEDEIAQMRAWLQARGLPAPDPTAAGAGHGAHGGHHAGMDHGAAMPSMPGMLSAAQLDTLGRARGAAFDALFLRYMIAHHEGALTMVAELFATPGAGQDSQIYGFAADVDADQRAEIARMRALLARITRPAPARR